MKNSSLWRRWLQFSLRTLMLAMLILPIGLGWLAQARSKSQQAWANVGALKANCYHFDKVDRLASPWWARTLGIDLPYIVEGRLELVLREEGKREPQADVLQYLVAFPHLKSLSISYPKCSAESLEPLTQLPELEELKLDLTNAVHGPMSLPSLPHLKHLEVGIMQGLSSYEIFSATPSLETLLLDVNENDLKSPQGLGVLKGLKRLKIRRYGTTLDEEVSASKDPLLVELGTLSELEDLELGIDFESGVSIKPITQLKKLKRLAIDGQITNVELAMLCEITSLEHLNISLQKLTKESAQHLTTMKNLRSLQVDARLTVRGMEEIATIPALENLVVFSWQPLEKYGDSADVLEPLTRCPQLKHFGFHEEAISAQEIEVISRIVALEDLEIDSLGISPDLTDEGIKPLTHLSNLQRLAFIACESLTDKGVKTLASTPTLKELRFYGSSATLLGVQVMQNSRPELKIDLVPYSPFSCF